MASLLAVQLSMSDRNESAGTGILSQMLSHGGLAVADTVVVYLHSVFSLKVLNYHG